MRMRIFTMNSQGFITKGASIRKWEFAFVWKKTIIFLFIKNSQAFFIIKWDKIVNLRFVFYISIIFNLFSLTYQKRNWKYII